MKRQITARQITGRGEEDVVIGVVDDQDPLYKAVRALRRAGPRRAGYTKQKVDEDRAWWFYTIGADLAAAASIDDARIVVARARRECPSDLIDASERRAIRALGRLEKALQKA